MSLSWSEFDRAANVLAEQLAGVGVARGDRVGVWHGDSGAVHVLFVAIERCGAVVVGIGARAGIREVAAILRSSQPKVLISDAGLRTLSARLVTAAAYMWKPGGSRRPEGLLKSQRLGAAARVAR